MQKMSELFFLALPHLVEFLWKLPLKQSISNLKSLKNHYGEETFSLFSLSLYSWCTLYKMGSMHSNSILRGEAVPQKP